MLRTIGLNYLGAAIIATQRQRETSDVTTGAEALDQIGVDRRMVRSAVEETLYRFLETRAIPVT
jgi:hypothetical protein